MKNLYLGLVALVGLTACTTNEEPGAGGATVTLTSHTVTISPIAPGATTATATYVLTLPTNHTWATNAADKASNDTILKAAALYTVTNGTVAGETVGTIANPVYSSTARTATVTVPLTMTAATADQTLIVSVAANTPTGLKTVDGSTISPVATAATATATALAPINATASMTVAAPAIGATTVVFTNVLTLASSTWPTTGDAKDANEAILTAPALYTTSGTTVTDGTVSTVTVEYSGTAATVIITTTGWVIASADTVILTVAADQPADLVAASGAGVTPPSTPTTVTGTAP